MEDGQANVIGLSLDAGALDAYTEAILMEENRSVVKLRGLCRLPPTEEMADILLRIPQSSVYSLQVRLYARCNVAAGGTARDAGLS